LVTSVPLLFGSMSCGIVLTRDEADHGLDRQVYRI
jgi:hypothetical protein